MQDKPQDVLNSVIVGFMWKHGEHVMAVVVVGWCVWLLEESTPFIAPEI